MIRFNARGHEIVDSTPFEPSVYLNRPPRETLSDQIRRMMMLERMEANDQIVDEAGMMEDLNDFSDDTSDENLFTGGYEMSEDIPDGFSAAEFREQAKQAEEQAKQAKQAEEQAKQAKQNSVSKEGSGTEPSGGTE